MILYQPTIVCYKYSFFGRKWKIAETIPSTIVFEDYMEAEAYWGKFESQLIRQGIKLKGGNYRRFQANLILNDKS